MYFDGDEVFCRWVVDASGRRGKVLKRQLGLAQANPIRHGATFCWVDGLVNIEKLTSRTYKQVLCDPSRKQTGHSPFFLATNHFCAEGQWFWVIPLHNKTSLGLVYDRNVVNGEDVSNTRKLIDYVCRKWPVFARDLPYRKVLDEGRLIDYSHDCRQTISPQRWAMVGEAGRFTDPLYSPGSDLISIYNTLIVDAIETDEESVLIEKCRWAEHIQRAAYESYVPSYAVSYDCLGDQEAFSLKYTWELAVYFGFLVFPMFNQLFSDRAFIPAFLRRFGILGPINTNLQRLLSAFFQWKKQQPRREFSAPNFFEFYDMDPPPGCREDVLRSRVELGGSDRRTRPASRTIAGVRALHHYAYIRLSAGKPRGPHQCCVHQVREHSQHGVRSDRNGGDLRSFFRLARAVPMDPQSFRPREMDQCAP